MNYNIDVAVIDVNISTLSWKGWFLFLTFLRNSACLHMMVFRVVPVIKDIYVLLVRRSHEFIGRIETSWKASCAFLPFSLVSCPFMPTSTVDNAVRACWDNAIFT